MDDREVHRLNYHASKRKKWAKEIKELEALSRSTEVDDGFTPLQEKMDELADFPE
ncbi:hypothetical protein A8926_6112 [Saccharopolyspora spinosa]|uniref:Uncharacterized protein n=1 Tax=Saccharopolyspora spinosa TaxID=60894 RepID=A0A2N3Y556_SACSN|nr:hypothetical protein A8926_6112 [Saccharopolyspora spinosa]